MEMEGPTDFEGGGRKTWTTREMEDAVIVGISVQRVVTADK